MRVFALDLSTHTGWALFEGPTTAPICGTLRLPKAEAHNYAARTLPLRGWLEGVLMRQRPDAVAFESPWIPLNDRSIGTTQHTLRLQISLAAEIETTVAEYRIRCFEIASSTAKKALVGRGRSVDKATMVAAAIARGWSVSDDHQADACGVAVAVFDILGTPVPLRLVA